jgi:beta-galactosidase
VAIRLTADRTEINADGEDVAVLERWRCSTRKAARIPTAANMISFKVTGEGALIGVGNGDPNCQESDKEPKRSLFNGLAQVIVQSTALRARSRWKLDTESVAAAEAASPRRVTITTKKVELRPAVE